MLNGADFVEAFMECVERYPERPAIVHGNVSITYRELAGLARAAAAELGPEPGVVGVESSRSPTVVVALLGVLAAGGAYCPIDPTFPVARRRALVQTAGVRTLICAAPAAADVLGVRPVTLPDAPTSTLDLPRRRPAHPAYVLFTSGSTGTPKAVLTPHQAIAVTVPALAELFGLGPEDRVLQFASLNWDTCFEEILPTLTTGAALVFDPEAYAGSMPRFLRMVAAQRITVLDLPTAFWHELVHHMTEDGVDLPGCVRLVVIGGEAVSPARLAAWRERDTARIRLLNTYGCTETTMITHAVDLHGPLTPDVLPRTGCAPIGLPLPHVAHHIDDGELLIGGPGLALGYLGQPEETADRFVERDRRYFRTGDRVNVGPGGLLRHEGRIDHEIKMRGIRVAPAEVEAHLASHPDVVAAAVVGQTVAGRTTMTAYVVARPATTAADLAAEIRADLRSRVPGYLVPNRIAVVPDLAYTASGKVDRTACHRKYQHTTLSRRSSP